MAQAGSAPDWGSGGRRFKSGRPDQYPNLLHDGQVAPTPAYAIRSGSLLVHNARRLLGACVEAIHGLRLSAAHGVNVELKRRRHAEVAQLVGDYEGVEAVEGPR